MNDTEEFDEKNFSNLTVLNGPRWQSCRLHDLLHAAVQRGFALFFGLLPLKPFYSGEGERAG